MCYNMYMNEQLNPSAKHRALMILQHKCVQCGTPLPPEDSRQKCVVCLAIARRATLAWTLQHPEQVKKHASDYYARRRAEVQTAYGNRCACCGETEPAFLTIDHINNDGHLHRKSRNHNYYLQVKREGFPKDKYQLLCMNCNCAKAWFGVCPHQSG